MNSGGSGKVELNVEDGAEPAWKQISPQGLLNEEEFIEKRLNGQHVVHFVAASYNCILYVVSTFVIHLF